MNDFMAFISGAANKGAELVTDQIKQEQRISLEEQLADIRMEREKRMMEFKAGFDREQKDIERGEIDKLATGIHQTEIANKMAPGLLAIDQLPDDDPNKGQMKQQVIDAYKDGLLAEPDTMDRLKAEGMRSGDSTKAFNAEDKLEDNERMDKYYEGLADDRRTRSEREDRKEERAERRMNAAEAKAASKEKKAEELERAIENFNRVASMPGVTKEFLAIANNRVIKAGGKSMLGSEERVKVTEETDSAEGSTKIKREYTEPKNMAQTKRNGWDQATGEVYVDGKVIGRAGNLADAKKLAGR